MFETNEQKRTIQRWLKLAIQLTGAADSGRYPHITTGVIRQALQDSADVFGLLQMELPGDVWKIASLTDVDRHTLSKQWAMMATAYEPAQFHVERNGLALLVAYTLHIIGNMHAVIPR